MTLDEIGERARLYGDPVRLRILQQLATAPDCERDVGQLTRSLAAPQPTISRHLARLLAAGVVKVRADGRRRVYGLPARPTRIDGALREALGPSVSAAPATIADTARALTLAHKHETQALHVVAGHTGAEEDEQMDAVFSALRSRTRRHLLDMVRREPGATIATVAVSFSMSRTALSRHIDVLEAAGLIISRRSGRDRLLHANVVPIQAIYDRWTDEYSAPLAAHMTAVKRAAEAATTAEDAQQTPSEAPEVTDDR